MTLQLALTSGVIAALVGGLVSLVITLSVQRREDRRKREELLADAFAAFTAYCEFPFAIRRRQSDTPSEERRRLSEELREVQAKVNFYLAWTRLQGDSIGNAYSEMIRVMRKIAGTEIARAWSLPAAKSDEQMNIVDVDLSSLKSFEDAYLAEISKHL